MNVFGLPGIYFKVGGVLVLVCLSIFFTHRYDTGQEAERNLANEHRYAQALLKAENDARAKEASLSNALAQSAASYQQSLRETNRAKDARIAALLDGSKRLYVDANTTACGSAMPKGSESSGGPTATARIELPPAIGAGLESLGGECDGLADAYRTAYGRLKSLSN